MFTELLRKLSTQKVETAHKAATEWQSLVVALADGKKGDLDSILIELDRLGKTPEDLESAMSLLAQRRAWETQVADGLAADIEHPRLKRMAEAKAAAWIKFVDEHQAQTKPIEDGLAAARLAMTVAGDARRELMRTATDPLARQTVLEADAKLADLRREQEEHSRNLFAMQDRLRHARAQESADIRDDDLRVRTERLTRDIEAMKSAGTAFDERARKLNAAYEAAREGLLNPEA